MAQTLTAQNKALLEEHVKRCINDREYALREMIFFPDKKRKKIRYQPWPSQLKFLKHQSRMNGVIKVRRQGFTVGKMADMMVSARVENNYEGLILHKDDKGSHSFKTLKYMDDHLSYPWGNAKKVSDSATSITYKDTNSSVRIMTAGQTEAQADKKGRGDGIHDLLITEAGYIKYLPSILQGAVNSVTDDGRITMESTSSGPRGAFSQFCLKIMHEGDLIDRNIWGIDDQRFFFFGFLEHPEYLKETRDGDSLGSIDKEEERLLTLGANQEHLNWRRWKIRQYAQSNENLKLTPEQQFKREFPAILEDAMEEAGGLFFERKKIVAIQEFTKQTENKPIETGLVRSENGNTITCPVSPGNKYQIWLPPAQGWINRYVFFADCGQGSQDSDLDVGYMLDVRLGRVVAKYSGKLGAELGSKCALDLCHYYSNALLSWDATGIGAEWRPYLIKSGYPNVYRRVRDKPLAQYPELSGLWWTRSNKPYALSMLRIALEQRTLICPDEKFYDETAYFGYQETDDISPEAASGFHDDHIMALAGLVYCADGVVPIPQEKPKNQFETVEQVTVKKMISQARSQAAQQNRPKISMF